MDAISAAEKQKKVEIGKAVTSVKVNLLTNTTTLTCFESKMQEQKQSILHSE